MYYFFIGSFEKGGFQNSNIGNSKYLGRAKTKGKYIALMDILSVDIFDKSEIGNESDKIFFNKYKDNITGDLYFIDNNKIIDKLDYISEIEEKESYKNKIVVIDLESKKEIEAICLFRNKKINKGIENTELVNEYSNEEKIKAIERVILMQQHKGKDTIEEWTNKLNKLKEENDKDI
jgi:hypothetical protein